MDGNALPVRNPERGPTMGSLLVRDGVVVDGTGEPRYCADLRIEGGRIFDGENLTDIRIFDATGRRYQTGLSLPHGTYIVSGKVSGKTVTKKLIVHP